MKAYIVSYDLNRPGQNYPKLWDAIKSYGTYYHMQGSVWVIGTNRTAVQIRDHLATFIDGSDSLSVALLSGEAAWNGSLDSKWIKDVLGAPVHG